VPRGVAFLAAVAVLAGCGSTSHVTKPPAKPCISAKAARAIVRIDRDIAIIRTNASANHLTAVSAATDRFMNDVFTAPISKVQQNRFIDHAAAALEGTCPQCFQALEANRPIVTIVHEAHNGDCQK
jgi:hypothetical protein